MKIGDRVIVNGLVKLIMVDKEFNNQSGIIIDIPNTDRIGIEFDSYMDGHDCGSIRGKNGHCWYVDYRDVIMEDNIATFKEELDKITL